MQVETEEHVTQVLAWTDQSQVARRRSARSNMRWWGNMGGYGKKMMIGRPHTRTRDARMHEDWRCRYMRYHSVSKGQKTQVSYAR